MKTSWNNKMSSVFFVLTCGVLLGAVSCDSVQETDRPTSREYDAIARGIAPLVSAELKSNGILETSTKIVIGDEPSWIHIDSTGKLEGSLAGLTWDVLSECQNSNNENLEVCDDTTDKAQVTALINGSLTLPNYKAALDIDSKWSFENLQGSTITADGATTISADSDFDSLLTAATRTCHFDLDFNFDFQIPTEQYEAISGTGDATVEVHYSKDDLKGNNIREEQFVVDAHLTVDGDGHATLTLDGVAQYELNLEAGVVIRI